MRRAWYEALQRWTFKRSSPQLRAYILAEQHKQMQLHDIVEGGLPLTAYVQHNILHAIDDTLTEWEEQQANAR